MVNTILGIFNKEWNSINATALLLGVFSILSQFLGLIRDRALAHFIGPSPTLDIYYAAFRIPDFIYVAVASLVSVTILLPFLSEKIRGGNVGPEAREFFSNILTAFLITIVVVSALVFILMPFLSHIVVPGFSPEERLRFISTSRIMLLSPIFLGISNMLGTVTQLFRKFFVFSIAPLFYNLGILLGVFVFYPLLGLPGLALGVVTGALLHLFIQFPTFQTSGFSLRIARTLNFKHAFTVFEISLPRTIGLSLSSFSIIVLIAIASTLPAGSISIFNFSFNLQSVPLGVIGISYAVALFPILVQAKNNADMARFRQTLERTISQVVFWSLPIMFLFLILRAQIVRVVLGSGAFSWDDTRLVAAALGLFALSLLAQNLINILIRAYYASGNTTKPLWINSCAAIVTIFSAVLFLHVFNHSAFARYFFESLLRVDGIPGTAILMLPLAFVVGSYANFVLLWLSVKKDILTGSDFSFTKSLFQSFAASFFIGFVAYHALGLFALIFSNTTFIGVFSQGFFAGILGIAAGIFMLWLMKNKEFFSLVDIIHQKFWKTKIIPTDTPEVHA